MAFKALHMRAYTSLCMPAYAFYGFNTFNYLCAMVAVSIQLEQNCRAIEREAKIAWYLHFLSFILRYLGERIELSLDSLYLTLLGALEVSDTFTPENAMKELNSIKKMQKTLLRVEAIIGKSDFLYDMDLKEKWNNCLDALYKLEGKMRIKAYSGKSKTQTDRVFIHSLYEKSKHNTESVIARYAI